MRFLVGMRMIAALTLLLAVSAPSGAEDEQVGLARLSPLVGGDWVCTKWDGEKPKHKQIMRWEPILEGNAIRETMTKPEIGFSREGLLYWDPEEELVASLVITNNGLLGHALVSWEGRKSVWVGRIVGAGGSMEQKETLELLAPDHLRIISYTPSDEGWVQRHVLDYTRETTDSRSQLTRD